MRPLLRFLLSACVLLLAAPAPALAESPMPEPIAPAVIGRPLDQVRRARVAPSKPAAAKPAPRRTVAKRSPTAAPRKTAAAAAARKTAALATAQAAQGTGRGPKQAVDDRADPRMRPDDVGKGTRLARKPLGTGAYIGERHRSAVRQYYEQHPGRASAADWEVGEPVPRQAPLAAVPPALLASLPELPPGYRYVQLGDEVVMIASGSRMVVDGISREAR